MRYIIYHPRPGKDPAPAQVECQTYEQAKAEYKRLQEIYPSRQMALHAINEYGERARIHSGRWD